MGKLIDKLKERSKNPNRQLEKGIVNDSTGSSLTLGMSGNVTVASSKHVQYKMNYASGSSKEIAIDSQTIANRKRIKVDELIINGHKLNPQIYELTNMKELYGDPNYAIGNLTMSATVLVKAWEPNLEKWVLIRRPIRTPLFYNKLNIPGAPKEMDIDDNITKEIEESMEE